MANRPVGDWGKAPTAPPKPKPSVGQQAMAARPPYASAGQYRPPARNAAVGQQAVSGLPPYASPGQLPPAQADYLSAFLPNRAAGQQAVNGLPPYASPGQLSPELAALLSASLPDAYGDNDGSAPIVQMRTSGSGRVTSDSTGGGGGSVGATAFTPPATYTAPPAAVMPPPVSAEAPTASNNPTGESFTSIGNPGTFGGYERRRQARGPTTGMSVTPEMIRRAAASRLG